MVLAFALAYHLAPQNYLGARSVHVRFWVIAAVVSQPLPAEARCARLRRLRDYLAAAVSPGGKIRNMKVETFSPGLNGPGV